MFVASLWCCACQRSSTEDAPQPTISEKIQVVVQKVSPGHVKMLSILKRIKDRSSEEHPYFGLGQDRKLRHMLANLAPGSSNARRFQILSRLGLNELLCEETPQLAIEHLTQAYDLLEQLKFPDRKIKQFQSNRVKFTLAVAYLRLGETENCCLRYSSESCILPIRGGGLHTEQKGSRQAIKYFQEVLDGTRGSTEQQQIIQLQEPARWLLNIAYMTLGEYPDRVPPEYRIPPEFFESDVEFPRFENVAPKLGLDTFSLSGGAIVDDFDQDDYLDIFTTTSDPTGQTRLFHNNRDGTFTDVTQEAGLMGFFGGLNAIQADFNNDGNLDVYIVRGAWLEQAGRQPNSLLKNQGDGTFVDVTFEAGLGEVHSPCKTAAWADFDNDGFLDLLVANEAERGFSEEPQALSAPLQLFRNNGDETFTDVAESAGIRLEVFGMGSTWGDFNQDRYPDLFVSGRPANHLFQNNGDGTFTDVTMILGASRTPTAFPVWFWDFDNDGALDLYVSNGSPVGVLALKASNSDMGSEKQQQARSGHKWTIPQDGIQRLNFSIAALYRGDGDGGFVDVARQQNLTYPTAPMGANFGDLNGDGFLDFYLATGDVPYWELRPNVMFLNQGGKRFANVTMAGGFGHLQKGHGVSFADIDNDGDQDVYVQMGGSYIGDKFNDALFENPGFGMHWISIALVGRRSNRSAIGARIHVKIIENGKLRSIFRQVNSGGSFGCNPLRQYIGLGNAERIESVEIYWPTTDRTQTFYDLAMDQWVRVVEGEKQVEIVHLEPYVLGGK